MGEAELDLKLRNSWKILEMAKSCPYHVLRSGIEVFGNMIFLFFSDIFDPFFEKKSRNLTEKKRKSADAEQLSLLSYTKQNVVFLRFILLRFRDIAPQSWILDPF